MSANNGFNDVIMRCAWARGGDALYTDYHDREWGTPSFRDRHLFEMLILEGFQAGLSWRTILNKREAFREAFDGFDPERVARYGPDKTGELMQNRGIVRNRLKILSAVGNAQAFLCIQKEYGSFSNYLWGWVDKHARSAGIRPCPGQNAAVRRDQPGPCEPRHAFCRVGHYLFFPAGGRCGQRP